MARQSHDLVQPAFLGATVSDPPRDGTPRETSLPARRGRAVHGRTHAFVVDDEAQVRSAVANALIASGYVAHELATGIEVEAALIQWPPALIVLDLALGNSDAIEVIRMLAANRYGGSLMLISGRDEATLEEVHQIGERRGLKMLPSLTKPFRLETLRDAIEGRKAAEGPRNGDINLETALKNDWLELWYQPKIDLRSMLICGAEALVRLRHPAEGIVLPERFLPRPGDPLYHPLTDYVVRRTLHDWSVFADHRMTNRLAINVPASVLQRPGFVANLRQHLPRHPKFPGLIVEVTEDEAISDPELAREIAVQLKLYDV